jgi:hypothetical protein
MHEIAARRLHAHRLTGEPHTSPVEAVRWLAAVQSQDYAGAKWALAQRSRSTDDAELDRLFDSGAILRTHLLRPTWHFVLPEDAGWMQRLTGPRVRLGLAGRYRDLGIDSRTVERAQAAFMAGLAGGRHLTRQELGDLLLSAGISPEGQRLPHLIMAAELDGLLISGARRGKQFTYALMRDRVTGGRSLGEEAALSELILRFFRSRGPAQLQDLVWWSGLTGAQARAGIAALGATLERRTFDGKDYWAHAEAGPPPPAGAAVHLLPNFDEYTVGYRDRAALHTSRPFEPSLFSFGSILSNIVTVAGQVRGAWRRTPGAAGVRLEIRALGHMAAAERQAVQAAGQALAGFLGKPVDVIWVTPAPA